MWSIYVNHGATHARLVLMKRCIIYVTRFDSLLWSFHIWPVRTCSPGCYNRTMIYRLQHSATSLVAPISNGNDVFAQCCCYDDRLELFSFWTWKRFDSIDPMSAITPCRNVRHPSGSRRGLLPTIDSYRTSYNDDGRPRLPL